MSAHALCVDFGSTFTKTLLVDLGTATLVATATSRTTVDTDLMDGYDACVATLRADHPEVSVATPLACSSAGGGLRIAVVGQEELVTAEAGRRVALSSGGLVAGVLSHPHDEGAWERLAATARPDVVLLTGGTDGGNAAPLLAAAAELAVGAWRGPVVIAGNAAAREEARRVLTDAGLPVLVADNVLPRIGVLAPDSARTAVRTMFLDHVIGGKRLSARPAFRAMVRGATPDVVLRGVEVVAAGLSRGVAVVDVGGATTDVHSVVPLDAETAGLRRDVVAATAVTRTVEGDLGMRWSAASTVAAARAAGLVEADLVEPAARRTAEPGLLPGTAAEVEEDLRLARAAVLLAVRRHAGRARVVLSPEGRVIERTGRDLREVELLVGSGGVLRAVTEEQAAGVLAATVGEDSDGWQRPRSPALSVDRTHLLVAVGLLAADHPAVAARLAAGLVPGAR